MCPPSFRRRHVGAYPNLSKSEDTVDRDSRVSGETPAAPGLRFLGFSALIRFVGEQSARVAKKIAHELSAG
jgi:hypothetical protein